MKIKRMKNRSDGDEIYLEEQEKSRSIHFIQNRKTRTTILVTINLGIKYSFCSDRNVSLILYL
jgi:hypothetical protein